MKLKLSVVVILLASLQAYAGTDLHMISQTCYALEQSYDTSVPSEFCLETLDINLAAEKITAYSFFDQYAEIYKNLSLNYFARKNEDGFSFRSQSVISDKTENGLSEKQTLKISGVVDNYGIAEVHCLNITLVQELTNSYHDNAVIVRLFNYRIRE